MAKNKLRIRKDDTVMVISGVEQGKKGKVLKVIPETHRVIVERLNFVHKSQRPTQRQQKGGIIEKEAPLHVSNVMLICSKCGQPTRVGVTELSDGRKARVCRRCEEVIDK
jgi:large subunit ribosomal protein L24